MAPSEGYTMRRVRQQTDDAEAREILSAASWGTLVFLDAQGLPYAVPMNHVLVGNTLYFHGSIQGRRGSALAEGPIAASFVAVAEHELLPAEITTAYRSVMCEGTLSKVEDLATKERVLRELTQALTPQPEAMAAAQTCIARGVASVGVFAFEIERMSGKVGSSIAKERAAARRAAKAAAAAAAESGPAAEGETGAQTELQDARITEGTPKHE